MMYAAEGSDPEQVLERIARLSAELVNARYAALGIPDGKGGLRYFKVYGMTPEEIARLPHLPRGEGLIGAILKERKPVRLANMRDDPRSGGFCAAHPPMTSLLGVPIQVGQQLYGTLYLCDRNDGQPFDEQDEWLIETMAGYAALAIVGSDLREKQHRLTLLEERERIGMELHDGVIQSLYALGMQLDLIRSSGAIQSEEVSPVIDGLNEVIEDIRRYILNLKTRGQQQKTIREILVELVNRLHLPTTLHVEIDAPEIAPIFPQAIFEAICQIINEAMSNVVRHANASSLKVTVRQDDRNFDAVIIDNGTGFELPDASQLSGLGLRNIQTRARLYGGQVHIDSAPGKGTTVTIHIPA